MFEVSKKENTGKEVIICVEDEDQAVDTFIEVIADTVSNFDEYTCGDIEAIKEQRFERWGRGIISLQEV